jgi:hypothetical protein
MKCIFCDIDTEAKSVEHIVSESFGNKDYVMQKGKVCDTCNGRFSKFEDTALTNSVFIMERARFGVVTKKGNNAKGKVNNLTIAGDKEFRPSYLTVKGLTLDNFEDFDHLTQTGHIVIASFDKSEVATSKLVLKIGLESIYVSQRTLFKKYVFKELKDFLTSKTNNDWPFLTTDFEIAKFCSVPRFSDKFRLKKNHCDLKYLEVDEQTLLFKFKYGAIPITLNLINRNLDWVKKTLAQDEKAILYPEHFRNKLVKR